MIDNIFDKQHIEATAFVFLCKRLQRDPCESFDSDTCTLRAASKAMAAFLEMAIREREAIGLL